MRWMAAWRDVRLREAAERVASLRLMESASMQTLSMLCASSNTITHSFSNSLDTCNPAPCSATRRLLSRTWSFCSSQARTMHTLLAPSNGTPTLLALGQAGWAHCGIHQQESACRGESWPREVTAEVREAAGTGETHHLRHFWVDHVLVAPDDNVCV